MKCEKCNKEIESKEITKSLVIKRLKENYYKFSNIKVNEEFRCDLKKIKYDLSKADLSEADLSEANLSKANLREANLSKANLSKANLSKADLSETDLIEADLREANLSEANLSKAYYWKTNFKYCKVTEKVKKQIIKSMKLVLEEKK